MIDGPIQLPLVSFDGVMLKSQPQEETEANSTKSRDFQTTSTDMLLLIAIVKVKLIGIENKETARI
ncbi:hypothetical protein MTR_4g046107 [Medicago truncatula]|uniref:Uncharacterized protein n=1 Tax=Medicago truncatula TaxID=3880 RepID=A0A072UIW0_MEDTR|nr:hypothetical protein MTR_4g046107 [Medicago truncatula]